MEGMASPLRGADGNVEFLVHARTAPQAGRELDVDRLIAECAT
jgi:hypothetical protein